MADERMTSVMHGITAQMIKSHLDQMIAFEKLPWVVEMRRKSQAEWDAKPWHYKLKRRVSVKVEDARIKIGEIIAGREFE
jgi:hypothetical protein